MECDPTDSDDVAKIAWLFVIVPVPNTAEPSLNVTVPVGVPLPGGLVFTVAVKVMLCPNTDGFAEDITEVDVSDVVCVLPVPLRGMEVGTPLKLFEIVSVPVLGPAAVGVNVTLIVQSPLLGIGEATQLSVSEKSPVVVTETIFSEPTAVFVTVTACAALATPMLSFPKLVRLVGDTVTPIERTVTGITRLMFSPFTLYIAVMVA